LVVIEQMKQVHEMKIHYLIKTILIIAILIGLISCKTYYIPVESFKEQFKGIDSTKLRIVKTRGPAGDVAEYLANPIDSIRCFDKNNNPLKLKNSPSIEIRFTQYNKKRTVFYFDRVCLQDTLIIGEMSRFIQYRRSISIKNVILIEVQDGHKDFKYVEKKK
jgi:hypothetical protein